MPVARRERMRNLVKNRVAHLGFTIQQRQRPRQRDALARTRASSKPSTCMIEMKRPPGHPMTGHQRTSEIAGGVKIHRSFNRSKDTPIRRH